MREILFFWNGLTAYGVQALEALRKRYAAVTIVAIRSSFPYEGIENMFGGRIVWVKPSETCTLEDLCGTKYGVVFTSGWNEPIFNRFCREARKAGHPVVCCVDNNWELTWRNVARAARFRLMQRGMFDAFFVPGASGTRLLRFFGVPKERIVKGFYSGDDTTFGCRKPMAERRDVILCVGQLNERKNVLAVAEGFLRVADEYPTWTLEFCGRGPLRDRIPCHPRVVVNDFLQPAELSEKYQAAKAFVLASREEHWGVVVHEAALSGCALLLSNRIGASPDFLTKANGLSFNPMRVGSIANAMRTLMGWDILRFDQAQHASVACASKFGRAVFAERVLDLSKRLGGV